MVVTLTYLFGHPAWRKGGEKGGWYAAIVDQGLKDEV